MIFFRYGVGAFFALLGAIALSANSYLLGNGAVRWAHEHDVWERAALAAGGAIVPWALALLPMLFAVIVSASFVGRQGQRGLILVLWVIFFFYNFMMGTSNIAKLREDTVAVAEHGRETLDADKDRRLNLRSQLAGIPSHRPPESVAPLLDAQRNQKAWKSSEGCTDVTKKASRDFCDGYKALESELAAGRAAEKVTAEIDGLDGKIAAAPPTTTAKADPFVESVSEATGFSQRSVRVVLAMLTPFILEVMGAAFWKVATILFGWSLKPTEASRSFSGGDSRPPLLYSPEAINRPQAASLEALTRAQQLCRWFFRECAKPAPSGALLEREWYALYSDICRRHNDVPVPLENFRRIAARNLAGVVIQDIDGASGNEKHYLGYLPFVPSAQPVTT